jgi:exopolyphosphatase/guanosine-5'-triphosphate,3'-diphosphate pyrophosphatase
MSTRVAAIDVGSDSTRLLIADVDGPNAVRPVVRNSIPTQLSAGLYETGQLTVAAQARVLKALAQHAAQIEQHSGVTSAAVLTSAVRDAKNGAEFTAEVRRRFRINARVIDGQTEAELTYYGATLGRELEGRVLVVDVGGGSTDLMIGERGTPLFQASTEAGVVRKAARFLHGDPPRHEEVAALRANIQRVLEDAVPAEMRTSLAHGLMSAEGWTWRPALTALGDEGAEAAQSGILSRELVAQALDRLIGARMAELREAPGIHQARAPTLVAGTAIVIETMDAFGLDRLELAEGDLLEGLALRLASQGVAVG